MAGTRPALAAPVNRPVGEEHAANQRRPHQEPKTALAEDNYDGGQIGHGSEAGEDFCYGGREACKQRPFGAGGWSG